MKIQFEIDDIEANQFIADTFMNVDLQMSIGYWTKAKRDKDGYWSYLESPEEAGDKPRHFSMNQGMCALCLVELIKMRGVDYAELYDAADLDMAVQRAVFGEIKYA